MTHPPDFRALCAEKIDKALASISGGLCYRTAEAKHLQLADAKKALIDARALLATPAPEVVEATDEELIRSYCDARRKFYFEHAAGDSDQEDRKAATIYGLRAVLSRFAHPAPVPIPSELVTEALRDEWFGRYEFQTRHPLGLLPVAAEHGYRLGYQAAIAGPAPVPVGERLPELRGMFERILSKARCMENRTVGNIELADRLLDAVVDWALPLPQSEAQS